MRLEHHLVGGYVRYISPHITIIIIIITFPQTWYAFCVHSIAISYVYLNYTHNNSVLFNIYFDVFVL